MKRNQSSLTYFTIGETIQCFLKALNQTATTAGANPVASQNQACLVEETDLINHVLQEMVNQNLAEATDGHKLAVDYDKLFEIIEVLMALGLV